MEKIETFVEDIPSDVLAFHGGVDQLSTKVTDLIFPPTEDVSETPKNQPKDAVVESVQAPKKRGRPKGSKNKSKDVPVETDQAPKKRGRPKGSKNKSKDVPAETEQAPKKRGRPVGSKNKTKVQ